MLFQVRNKQGKKKKKKKGNKEKRKKELKKKKRNGMTSWRNTVNMSKTAKSSVDRIGGKDHETVYHYRHLRGRKVND